MRKQVWYHSFQLYFSSRTSSLSRHTQFHWQASSGLPCPSDSAPKLWMNFSSHILALPYSVKGLLNAYYVPGVNHWGLFLWWSLHSSNLCPAPNLSNRYYCLTPLPNHWYYDNCSRPPISPYNWIISFSVSWFPVPSSLIAHTTATKGCWETAEITLFKIFCGFWKRPR